MKQYLVKGIHGDYSVVDHHSGFNVDKLIEIPEGAEVYMKGNIYNFFGKYENEVLLVTNKEGIWVKSIYESLTEHNSPILWQRKPNLKQEVKQVNGGFVSGKEALIALAKGKDVIYICKGWQHLTLNYWSEPNQTKNFTINDFMSDQWVFKLKPKTITVTLELPIPFTPREGEYFFYIDLEEECGYSCKSFKEGYPSYDNNKIQMGAWRTSEEVKQVVEVLRGLKDAK